MLQISRGINVHFINKENILDGSVKLNWTSSQELCKDQIPGNLSEICKKMQTDKKEVWLHMHRVVLRNDVIHSNY